MTKDEAINILEKVEPKALMYDMDEISCTLDRYCEAVSIALEALKEDECPYYVSYNTSGCSRVEE